MQGSVGRSAVTLLLPAWNNEATIEQALREAVDALSQLTEEFEILVVDDGSTDRTPELVRRFAGSDNRVQLVSHPHRLGYGAALRSGCNVASFELVAVCNALCQFDLAQLRHMLPLAQQYDLVCGSRLQNGNPAIKRFVSGAGNLLTRLLVRTPLHDVDCDLKLFHRAALMRVLPESDGLAARAEMLHRAKLDGMKIGEVSVSNRPPAVETSQVNWRAILGEFSALLSFWWMRIHNPGSAPAVSSAPRWFSLAMALIAMFSALRLFTGLDYALFEPDEGRYAEIGRAMVASDQWLVPMLHQDPYLDKPPLFYWLVAASFRIFGPHDWAARLVPACAAWLSVLATGLLGRRIVGNVAGLLSAFILSLALGVVATGRFLVLDSVLSLFVALGLFCAYEAVRGERLHWRWWLASAIACGLGVLTKGPVAVLLILPPIFLHCWLTQRWTLLNWRYWLAYLVLAGLLVAPWFVAVVIAQPEFARYFLWEHNVSRFLSGLNHPEPFWYYLPVLLLAGLPWTFLIIPWVHFLFTGRREVAKHRSLAHGFLFLWGGWVIAFFSSASCKLPPYILPAAPALALLFGVYLDHIVNQVEVRNVFPRLQRWAPLWCTSALVFGLTALMAVACWFGLQTAPRAALVSLLGGLCLIPFALRRRWDFSPAVGWLLACLVMVVLTHQVTHVLADDFAQLRSPVPSAGEIHQEICDRRNAVIYFGRECGSIPFYLGRTDMTRVDDRVPQEMPKALANHKRTILLMRKTAHYDELRHAVPRSIDITRLGEVGRTSFWVLQSPMISAQRMVVEPPK